MAVADSPPASYRSGSRRRSTPAASTGQWLVGYSRSSAGPAGRKSQHIALAEGCRPAVFYAAGCPQTAGLESARATARRRCRRRAPLWQNRPPCKIKEVAAQTRPQSSRLGGPMLPTAAQAAAAQPFDTGNTRLAFIAIECAPQGGGALPRDVWKGTWRSSGIWAMPPAFEADWQRRAEELKQARRKPGIPASCVLLPTARRCLVVGHLAASAPVGAAKSLVGL